MRLSSAAHPRFRRLMEPAPPNLVIGTLADLPRRRTDLLAENVTADMAEAVGAVVLRALGSSLETSPAGYPAGPVAALASGGFRLFSPVLAAEVADVV